jgi:hypothetical protein
MVRVNDDVDDRLQGWMRLRLMARHGKTYYQNARYEQTEQYSCHLAPRKFRYVHLRHIYTYYIHSRRVVNSLAPRPPFDILKMTFFVLEIAVGAS